ncbi:transposase [Streptomyces sp. NBC_01497]|uniref:transposase n=1 Tax=Streptomyces sp. NBC_01497 TaxID=2903885 RepID=UPI003FCDA4EE
MTITDAIHQAVPKVPPRRVDRGRRAGRRDPGRCLGRRTRQRRPQGLAARDAADRPQGTPTPRRTVALHRRRRPAAHRVRHEHHGVPIAAPELRHRQRGPRRGPHPYPRATGPRNLPLHDTAQNQIWLEIVQLALDLPAWMPMFALTGKTRRWEPRCRRLRLSSAAAQLITTARRRHLRFARNCPWTDVITDAPARLEALPNPG